MYLTLHSIVPHYQRWKTLEYIETFKRKKHLSNKFKLNLVNANVKVKEKCLN